MSFAALSRAGGCVASMAAGGVAPMAAGGDASMVSGRRSMVIGGISPNTVGGGEIMATDSGLSERTAYVTFGGGELVCICSKQVSSVCSQSLELELSSVTVLEGVAVKYAIAARIFEYFALDC